MDLDVSSRPSDSGVEEVTSLFAKQNLHEIPIQRIHAIPPEERSEALYELHAALDPCEETPEFIAMKMGELDNAIICADNKMAYDHALKVNLAYVDSWKLRFLRAERFHTVRAAKRMIRHFETKQSMFGRDTLGRDLTLNDLTRSELRALKTGVAQVLSHRDQGGRALFIEMATLDDQLPIETVIKLQFLLAAIASEDQEVQKRGAALIFYAVGRKVAYMDRAEKDVGNWLSWPLRLVGIHACYDNPAFHKVVGLASKSMESIYVCRHQGHFGTHSECQANLALFGIPRHAIPLYPDGSIDCTHHLRWIKHAQNESQPPHTTDVKPEQQEATNPDTEVILMAGPLDVIMGRGPRKHSGNKRLKRVLELHLEQYEDASTWHKRSLCQQLLEQLTKSGTRFITPTESGGWERIREDTALEKIAHGFRDIRRDLRRQNESS